MLNFCAYVPIACTATTVPRARTTPPGSLPRPVPAQGHGGFLLPLLSLSWGTALLASMAGLAAPEAAAVAEQAAEPARSD